MSTATWLVPFGAAVLGGVLATAGSIATELFRRHHERRSLALAFRGELLAIIKIVEIRKYAEILDGIATTLHLGHSVQSPPIRIERDYFPVYAQNASRIGILPAEVAEAIARTYTFANSFIEDATMPRNATLTPAAAEMVEHTLEVLRHVLNEAEAAVMLVEKAYFQRAIR